MSFLHPGLGECAGKGRSKLQNSTGTPPRTAPWRLPGQHALLSLFINKHPNIEVECSEILEIEEAAVSSASPMRSLAHMLEAVSKPCSLFEMTAGALFLVSEPKTAWPKQQASFQNSQTPLFQDSLNHDWNLDVILVIKGFWMAHARADRWEVVASRKAHETFLASGLCRLLKP